MFGYVAFWILLEREVEFLIEKIEPGDTILVDLFGLRPISSLIFGLFFTSSLGSTFRTSFGPQCEFPGMWNDPRVFTDTTFYKNVHHDEISP